MLGDGIRSHESLVRVPLVKHVVGFEERIKHCVFGEPEKNNDCARGERKPQPIVRGDDEARKNDPPRNLKEPVAPENAQCTLYLGGSGSGGKRSGSKLSGWISTVGPESVSNPMPET